MQALAPPVDVRETIEVDGKEYDINIATIREHKPKLGLILVLILSVLTGSAFWLYLLSLLVGWKWVINILIGGLVVLLISHIYYTFKDKK